MEVCANCGYTRENPGAVCPNCGYFPRRPSSRGSLPDWALAVLGFIAVFVASSILPFLGSLFMLFVYFSIRDKHIAFAKGVGYGLMTILVLFLGALALCFALIFGGMGKH